MGDARDNWPVPRYLSRFVEAHRMDNAENTMSSVDAVRCFYLARVLERKGEVEAARRWNEQAHRWVESVTPECASTMLPGSDAGTRT